MPRAEGASENGFVAMIEETRHSQSHSADAPTREPGPSLDEKLLSAVHQSGVALVGHRDPAALSEKIIRILEQRLSYDNLAVLLINPITDVLEPFALSDRGIGSDFIQEDMQYIAAAKVGLGEGITGWVAQHGVSVLLDDVRRDSRYIALRSDIRSELCVPLCLDTRVLGVINVETVRPAAYNNADRQVLEIIATQLAVAIENARLFDEATRAQAARIIAEQAGDVAHDLGNILTALMIDAGRLADAPLGAEDTSGSVARLRSGIRHCVDLSRRLLPVGRHAPGQTEFVDLNDVIARCQGFVNAVAGQEISVEINQYPGALRVRATGAQLEQILLNLVVNACQAMGEGGVLSIRTAPVDASRDQPLPEVEFSVADTGCGMSVNVQKRAFEPYFTTRETGSGLGLATLARIMSELGGRNTIVSEPGKGTKVVLRLPRADSAGSDLCM